MASRPWSASLRRRIRVVVVPVEAEAALVDELLELADAAGKGAAMRTALTKHRAAAEGRVVQAWLDEALVKARALTPLTPATDEPELGESESAEDTPTAEELAAQELALNGVDDDKAVPVDDVALFDDLASTPAAEQVAA
jgi:hypothetical protein